MSSPRILVVGAGVAGLSAALELARRDFDVTVIEQTKTPGGKLRQVVVGEQLIDAGPTVLTMRWVFDELFEAAGSRLEDHVTLARAEVLARHAWSDTERLDLHAERAATVDAIGAFSGAAEARRYVKFCERAEQIWQTLETSYIRSPRPSPFSLVRRAGLRGLPALLGISPFTTLWDELGKYFHDPRLRQLFGRYATYCGSSPYLAPATLMLIAHVELAGVWRLDGGMHSLARGLAAQAVVRGARFRYGERVARIESRAGRVSGVTLDDGSVIEADAVVFNGDVAALASGRLGDGVRGATRQGPRAGRSLSAMTWTLLARTSGFELSHHNVFFSADYAAEFTRLFERRQLPMQPTVYVCAQDRNAEGAPHGPGLERLLCLVNAPAVGDTGHLESAEIERCETETFRLLTRSGLELTAVTGTRTTPADWERAFQATGGALYGQASHGWRAAFARPGAASRMPGLYLAGGSVHPGPGVPMAALSGRLAATRLLGDLGSPTR